jgi:hypothetical protein
VTPSPAVTVATWSSFDTVRGALVVTVMVLLAVAVLLPGVVLVTLTLFLCVPAGVDEGTVKVAVTVADWFIIRFPSEHVKLPLLVSGVQPLTDVRVKPLGHVSVSVTFWASGPVFVTVIVYVWVAGSPAVTVMTSAVLVTERLGPPGKCGRLVAL